MSQGTVGDLIKKLQAMHGHLSAKDRAVIVECKGALVDLSLQLWQATHPDLQVAPKPRGGFKLRRLEDNRTLVEEVRDVAQDPEHRDVLEDTDGSSVR